MKLDRNRNFELRKVIYFARAAMAVAALGLLAGCSSVPDWVDPTKWFGGSLAAQTNESGKTPAVKMPGEDKDFPNLASVPERPKVPSQVDRKRLVDSLRTDRDNAEYSKDIIRRQSASKVARLQKPVARAVPANGTSTGDARAPAPVSSLPQFAPRPPSPVIQAAGPNSVPPLAVRPSPNVQSIARIGNPSFGAPPADIAAALGGGSPQQAVLSRLFAPPPWVPGTFSNGTAPGGAKPLATVRFAAGSASLTRTAREQVRQIVGMYRQRGGAIRVEGHASSRTRNMDPVEHHLVNFNVSLKRANEVAREFVRQGVPSEAVFAAAMSDSQPLYYEVMPAGDAGNQRVEIHFAN